jgi:hypothetical protein
VNPGGEGHQEEREKYNNRNQNQWQSKSVDDSFLERVGRSPMRDQLVELYIALKATDN